MTIIIDSVDLNRECVETPPSRASTDLCVAEARFHLRSGEGTGAEGTPVSETIPFRRESSPSGASFYIQAISIPATLSAIITENHFDPSNAVLQGDLRNILTVHVRYEEARRMISRLETGPENAQIFEDLVNYMFLGEIDAPDPLQREANRSLYTRLAQTSALAYEKFRLLIDSFLFDNREWLNREDAEAIPRLERLGSVLRFSRAMREATARIPEDSPYARQLRELQGIVVGYLFAGEPAFSEVTRRLGPLSAEIYRETYPVSSSSSSGTDEEEEVRYNLYQVLLPALEAFSELPPFNTAGEEGTRLQLLTRFVEQPVHTRELEYSLLEPRQAFVRSLLDPLLESPQTEDLLEAVEDQIEAPDLDADWLRENGHLREIIEAIAGAISVEEEGEGEFQLLLDPARLRTRLNELFQNYLIDNREYIGGALAVLRHFMTRDSVRIFWEGQFREVPWNISSADRARIQTFDRSLESRIQRSLIETDLILPIIEAGVCAAGVGLSLWGGLDDSLPRDTRLGIQLGGGGTTGLGCGALATHFLIDSGNPYIADAIGGGIGAILGVAIPLLVHLLGGSSPPSMMMGPPIDGRNPTGGYGP